MSAPTHLFAPGRRVHFVGIGGAGMCALAEAMVRAGVAVSGSDLNPGPSVMALRELGVEVYRGHEAGHVERAEVVVRTSAVPESNPEVARALADGRPVLKRAEALGTWVERGTVVAVSGTHGKTSTTAMTTEVLVAAGLDPTAFVGGTVRTWGGNLRAGSDRLFVVEADEYDRSFHRLSPDIAIVTNVEADHLDVYGDLAGVYDGFRTFLGGRRAGGRIVACGDDPGAARVVTGQRDVTTYGTRAGSTLWIHDLQEEAWGTRFRLTERGESAGTFELRVPGLHNVLNATAAAGAARALDVSWDAVRDGLARYRGVGRRFERVGSVHGIDVLDDYAHHPTEVAATVAALRQAFPDRRLVLLFQPHLYSRTRDHHRAFAEELGRGDVVWVTDIYPAREAPLPGVSGRLISDGLERSGHAATRYHADVDSLAAVVAPTLEPEDVCVTLGAGSIESVGARLVRELEGEA